MIAIIIGVVSLVVLVGAFFASKQWHWAHVTTLVFFYFAVVGYAILGARSLEVRIENQKKEITALRNAEELRELSDAVARGADQAERAVISKLSNRELLIAEKATESGSDMLGVIDLENQLRIQNRIRGRVWRYVSPTNRPDPQTGLLPVRFGLPPRPEGEDAPIEAEGEAPAEPPALRIEPGAVVYLFEQSPPGGVTADERLAQRYLGEFRIEKVVDRDAVLEPLDQLELDPDALERLAGSRGPWILYETMPADSRDLFAGFDEEGLRRLLPAASVDEYLRDKTPWQNDDPEDRREPLDADGNVLPPDTPESEVVTTRYRRRLRDYTFLLNDFERERAALIARRQAVEADLEKLAESLEGAQKTETYRQEELAKWQADADAVDRDRRAIEAHVAALQSQVVNAKRLLQATLEENARLATARASKRGALTPIEAGALDINAL